MKKPLLCALVWLHVSASVFSINAYRPGDALYNWAYHGLNLRKAPATSGAKLAVIPYGARVIALDSVRVKAFSVKEYGGFVMHGYWSKVRVDSLEGWVFDGYLSKYAALRHVQLPFRNGPDPESYTDYGKREWGLKSFDRLNLDSDTPTKDSAHCRDRYLFHNGALFEHKKGTGDGGMFDAQQFQIPDLSFEECFLFFIYNAGFYANDPAYHPELKSAVETDMSGTAIRRTKTSVEIDWGPFCHYSFEKKGKMTIIKWYCAC